MTLSKLLGFIETIVKNDLIQFGSVDGEAVSLKGKAGSLKMRYVFMDEDSQLLVEWDGLGQARYIHGEDKEDGCEWCNLIIDDACRI